MSQTLRYSRGGNGNAASPAYIGFTFRAHAPRLEWLKEQFPSSVQLEEDTPSHFVLKGVDPSMSRSALQEVFYGVIRTKGWIATGEDAS